VEEGCEVTEKKYISLLFLKLFSTFLNIRKVAKEIWISAVLFLTQEKNQKKYGLK
jgi:hypothetical protein